MLSQNTKINLTSIVILYGLTAAIADRPKLSVVTKSDSVIHLYERVRNEGPPAEWDPALGDPRIRRRICEDLTGSGFFFWELLHPVKLWQIYHKLRRPQYSNIFPQIYTRSKWWHRRYGLLNGFEYRNPMTRHEFRAVNGQGIGIPTRTISTTEYAFLCLMMTRSKDVLPIYVSKEYNLFSEPYISGRFLFKNLHLAAQPDHYQILLAEQPATVCTNPNFNVELRYLEMRKYRQPVENRDDDPVCKLISSDLTKNQSYRLCAEIYGSAHFEKRIRYPRPWYHYECVKRKISFRTAEGVREAAENSYLEFMTPCETGFVFNFKRVTFYISRAYRRNQVFVYSVSRSVNGAIQYYLENLSINVATVDEHIGFDDVE